MRLRFAWLAIVFTSGCATAQFTHGAAIGELTPTEALAWVRTSRAADLKVLLAEEGSGRTLLFEAHSVAATDFTARTELKALRPNTGYSYEIRISGAASQVVRGSFRTPPARAEQARVRFVFGGDLVGQNVCRDAVQGLPVFQAMDERNPDFFIALGDMIYADSPCRAIGRFGNLQVPGFADDAYTLEDFRRVWRYARGDALYQRFLSRVPMYAVWDDHEVRNDFGPEDDLPDQKTSPRLFRPGARAFVEFNPLRRGVAGTFYREFSYGRNLDVFLLDTRSKRSPNAARDRTQNPKSMLGPEQRRRFVAAVTQSRAVWKVVVSSVPLSIPSGTGAATYGTDGWANGFTQTGFENELRAILSDFAKARVNNLVFLVTDVHFAAVHRYRPFPGQYPKFVFHEVITGPLQAGFFPTDELDRSFRPERLFAYGPSARATPRSFQEAKQWFNFGEVEVSREGRMDVRVITAEGKVVYTLSLPRS